MAFRKPEKKEDVNPQPDKATPFKNLGKRGLRSPTYKKRNPHKDSGDKKPSLKTTASIIKEKAKKGQGLAKGGMVKSIIRLIPGFAPTPKAGTISTIAPVKRAASRFVQRRKQLGGAKALDPVKKAMGGQASESVARSRVLADQKARDRQRLMDMLDRLKKKPGGTRPKGPKTKKEDSKKFMDRPILPKDKPKPKPIRPFMPKGKPKGKPKRAK